jgi:hypothetical protein
MESFSEDTKSIEEIKESDQKETSIKSANVLMHTELAIEESISKENISNKIESLVAQCKKEYFAHRLDAAYRLLELCEQVKEQAKGEILETIESILKTEKKLFETIKNEHAYMKKILQEMEDPKDWTSDSLSSAVKISYKYIPNTELISLKMEAEVDVSIQIMMTLINEISLWSHWFPFIKKTSQVKRLHRGAAVYYLELGLPYPLQNRETHIYGFGVDRLQENGSVLILAESVDENQEFLQRHDVKKMANSGIVNMDIRFSGFEIIPLGENRCKLRGIANTNPKFNWLPASLLNFLFKKGMQFVLDRLIKKAKNFKGSVWEKETLREEKREFYDWLNHIVEEYHKTHPQPGSLGKL